MSYTHPNGCKCMTMPEFLAAEGKRQGKTGGEVLDNIVADMQREDDRVEAEMAKPENALVQLQEAQRDFWDPDFCRPELAIYEVVKVLSARSHCAFRGSQTRIVARVRCLDCKIHTVVMDAASYSGSFYEPPDYDLNLRFVN